MSDKRTDVLYGSLGLIILTTLQGLGPLHGYRIAGRIGQISRDHLALNQGTLSPALLQLQQAGWIRSSWGESDSGRAVKIYTLTRAGRKHLAANEAAWQHATGIVARFFKIQDERS